MSFRDGLIMDESSSMSMYDDLSTLVGKTLSAVTRLYDDGDELHFTTVDGDVYRMYHSQDCCEHVSIEDICGDLEDLVGSPILIAEENTKGDPEAECGMWTFYKFATAKGWVDIRWYGGSNGYYFFVGGNRKTMLRMSDESEWENAVSNWGQNVEPRHLAEIESILQLEAMTAKLGIYVDSIKKADLSLLDVENFEETFSYVNNNFNGIVGFYENGEYVKFSAKYGGAGTSESGNHGTPVSWDGETYLDTLSRFISETGKYPTVMVEVSSCHESRQGDGYKSETTAHVLPSKEAIEVFFSSGVDAYNALKNTPITIL